MVEPPFSNPSIQEEPMELDSCLNPTGSPPPLVQSPLGQGGLAVLFVISVFLILSGSLANAFRFHFLGLSGQMMGTTSTVSFSLLSLISHIVSSVVTPTFGIYWLWFMILCITFFLPLLQLTLLGVFAFARLLPPTRTKVYRVLEKCAAWQSLDVFLLAFLGAVLEIGFFSQNMVNTHCKVVQGFLTEPCYEMRASFLDGAWLLIGGMVGLTVLQCGVVRYYHTTNRTLIPPSKQSLWQSQAPKGLIVVLCFYGLCLVLAGLAFPLAQNWLLSSTLEPSPGYLSLPPNTTLDHWSGKDVSETRAFYIWSIENMFDLVYGDSPQVQRIGPCTFRVSHDFVTSRPNASLIETKGTEALDFVPSASCPLETEVTVVDQVATAAAPYADQLPKKLFGQFVELFGTNYGFQTTSVREVLFNNTSPLAEWLNAHAKLGVRFPTQTALVQNRTLDTLTHTGAEDPSLLGSLVVNDTCWGVVGNRTGSAGLVFESSSVQSQQTLPLYNSQLRRPVNYSRVIPADFQGVQVHRYQIDNGFWLPDVIDPDNRPYHSTAWPLGAFFGMVNQTQCASLQPNTAQLPIFVTKPAFLDLLNPDVIVQLGSVKLAPELEVQYDQPYHRSELDTWMDVHPETGLTLFATHRWQFNVHLANLSSIYQQYTNETNYPLPHFIPLYYTETIQATSPATVLALKETFAMALYLRRTLLAMGGTILFVGVVLLATKRLSCAAVTVVV
eukprot:NODE_330_length_2398_cov_19.358432_g308_i0.p1 GENE.NODE_330_length_2398_cov_19.358432_g308_i0~~NODE_330_length_2398_cov_19.358432_g308_i0.p1  ORF type:complete len:785 (+),score=224.02 NODE_330_length_2398_cov_19.358432_g308_i0:180-2357(+)